MLQQARALFRSWWLQCHNAAGTVDGADGSRSAMSCSQEVLNGVALLNKTGPNRDKWQVRSGFLGEGGRQACGVRYAVLSVFEVGYPAVALVFIPQRAPMTWSANIYVLANALQVKPEYRGQHKDS